MTLSQVPRELAERLFDLQEAGRIMHESWARTKHAQGFHGPNEPCTVDQASHSRSYGCGMYHADLIPWEELPQKQKDINLNAFKDVFAVLKPKAEAVIREAMQRAQPQWISVEEKLPKVDEKVLAYAPKYAETAEESVITTWFEVDGWMVENDCGTDVEVTHWMPLPEPPNTAEASR